MLLLLLLNGVAYGLCFWMLLSLNDVAYGGPWMLLGVAVVE